MAINLPYGATRYPVARILYAERFNGTWTELPMWRPGRFGYGAELLSLQRAALPAVSEAVFQYRFGIINGRVVGSISSDSTVIEGSPWSTSDYADAPDLQGKHIRIQMAPVYTDPVFTSNYTWRTVWCGYVQAQKDTTWPGAEYPVGQREYHCVDSLFLAKQWPMNSHIYVSDTTEFKVEGSEDFVILSSHPGYNIGGGSYKSGTAWERFEDDSAGIVAHTCVPTLQWTDADAILHALKMNRQANDILFTIDDPASLLNVANPWKIHPGMTAWDFVSQVCRRTRGRGLAFLNWDDDSSAPTGPLTVKLSVRPMTLANITVTLPGETTETTVALGAAAASTEYLNQDGENIVDLIGDHRLISEAFAISERGLNVADRVESYGERIQACFTASFYDDSTGTVPDASLVKAWDVSYEATWAAMDSEERKDDAYNIMWTQVKLNPSWNGTASGHDGTPRSAAIAICDDAGNLTSGQFKVNPMLCEIMTDLVLHDGYSYLADPAVRLDGAAQITQPTRRPPVLYVREDADQYQRDNDITPAYELASTGNILKFYSPTDLGAASGGIRTIGDTTQDIGSEYDLTQAGFTITLELPNRVSMATNRTGSTGPHRVIRTNHENLHLWTCHGSAIWGLDDDGLAARRQALGVELGEIALIRDDRATLARYHALACTWYLQYRTTAKWALKDCGLFENFPSIDPDSPSGETEGGLGVQDTVSVPYPQLGQLVEQIAASGQLWSVNTPITAISYDHTHGITTWETDWADLDFQQ